MPPEKEYTPRRMTLTEADLEALATMLRCNSCSFSAEEVQFVKDWLDTMKTAKSEVVKWIVRGILALIGVFAAIQVAAKLGYFKAVGK